MHICLFDIDGTLISTGGAGMAAMRKALGTAFNIQQPTDTVLTAGRTDRAIVADFMAYHAIENSLDNWNLMRAQYLAHLPETLLSFPGRVLPGVPALLRSLAARDDVLLGLLTGNTNAGARVKLAHFGLADYFRVGGYGDETQHRDDVARTAVAAVAAHTAAEVDCNRVWVIGDTPLDVQCARAIGARVVAVATGAYQAAELAETNPDFLFEDLERHDFEQCLLA